MRHWPRSYIQDHPLQYCLQPGTTLVLHVIDLLPENWTIDFMSDQLVDGHRFRILTVLDVYTRECLALIAGQSFRGVDVANILSSLVEERERPDYIHCDNGCEFTSKIINQWA